MFGYVILALLFLWGVLMVAKPDLLWRIEHTDSVDREQPTERYITNMRIGGSICIVFAVTMLVLFLR